MKQGQCNYSHFRNNVALPCKAGNAHMWELGKVILGTLRNSCVDAPGTGTVQIRKKNWKQPKVLSTEQWIKKLQYINTLEYSGPLNMNEPESIILWDLPLRRNELWYTQQMMNLGNIMLHESTSPRGPHTTSYHVYNNQKHVKISSVLVRYAHTEWSCFPSRHRKSVKQPSKLCYQIISECFFFEHLFLKSHSEWIFLHCYIIW